MKYDMKEILELEKRIKQMRVDFIKDRFPTYRECTDEDCLTFYTCIECSEKIKREEELM